MADALIENPILNSPFLEPNRHFKFTDEGITNEVIAGRRTSSYFIPIARPKKKGKQLAFDTEWTQDRIEENKTVNRIRQRVGMWREGGYVGVSPTTAALLRYWSAPGRERKLFFCQIEALETLIFITEVAKKFGDAWIENDIREANDTSNPGLPRLALKMATGSGKTVVMAMLVAWQTLNKLANPQDARFSDTFLIVSPGITIRDRLRVLLPNDPNNYYRLRDIVPGHQFEKLGQARMVITNFHAFQLREKLSAGKLTKAMLSQGVPGVFTESPDQMVRRVCRELGTKKNIIVINDEAHHCYRRKPEAAETEALTGDDRKEAEKREEEARIWISGIEAVKAKIGVKAIYDLSATPFFLRGSGYSEGTLFPWVVSDLSLIDAIEAGIVKVPRVPVADDSMQGDQPTYRDLWLRIREHLPRKGRKSEELDEEPKLPAELEGAIQSLYGNYRKYHELWAKNADAQSKGLTPPVFIVVCNNTNVSKLVFNYISGWEKSVADGETIVVPGRLPLFNNEQGGAWSPRPNTILVDSEQLESGEGMSPEFKKIAAREIEEFKAEYRARFPGRDADELTEEDLLREVMNTVGKPGKLGEHVKCVVSVSMLTEGWDANTVTHVLGVRAFGTQLLCEDDSRLTLTTADLPIKTENAPIVGESSIHSLDELKNRRINEVAFLLAKLTLEKYFRQDGDIKLEKTTFHKFDSEVQAWLFPQVLAITKRWLDDGYVHCKDHTFPQLLLLIEFAHDAADRLYGAIVRGSNGSPDGPPSLRPILRPYDTVGSTRYVDFDTTRPVFATRADRCHISHVVADTDSWEQKMAQTLEDMDEVVRYVKNHNLGFTIPYTINGKEHQYHPDFIAVLDDGRGLLDPLNLIIEVSGEKKKEKAAKVMTAGTLWVPAVNNHGAFGRWAFLEVTDPYDALVPIRSVVRRGAESARAGDNR